jgi:hypothetical protein
MAIVTPYNHTTLLRTSGQINASATFKINLYSVLPANATATTKTAAESGATQLSTANGYTQNDKTVTGLAFATVNTNDARFTCNQVSWTASGGNIAAAFAMIYVDSITDDPPLYHYDFEGTITATDGIPFVIDFVNGLDLVEYV